jgi:predicted DNA-binding transcriptional regulator AlpA
MVLSQQGTTERSHVGTDTKTIENLLNEFDVARITGLSVASVRRWRLFGKGPQYLKIGAAVRYRAEDLQHWINAQPTGGGQGAQ